VIKHKIIVKHKIPPYIPPWERGYSGTEFTPDLYSIESRHYRAHVQAGAFTWMVYWSFKGKFNIQEIANSYWSYSTKEPFPEKGGTVDEICRIILKNLHINGHTKNRVILEDGEEDVFPDIWLEFWDNKKDIQINKENKMAKKFVDPGDGEEIKVPQGDPGGPRMTLKRRASIRCFELLIEQEYTDAEIIEMVKDELEYNFIPSMIVRRRKMLNEGEAEDFGFETPEEPIEEVGGEGESAEVTPRKPPLKPAKKKSTMGKPGLKKPLSLNLPSKKFKIKKFSIKKKA